MCDPYHVCLHPLVLFDQSEYRTTLPQISLLLLMRKSHRKTQPNKKSVRAQLKAMSGRDYHGAACMRALVSPSRGPTPFPDRLRCVLTYAQGYTLLLSSSNANARQQFSMNSLFDPDFTGTGAQPEFFDQLSALYNRYRVYGSAIKVTLLPFLAGVQANVPVNVVLVPSAQSLVTYNVEDAAGLPRAQNRISTGNMDMKNQTLLASHSISQILGVKDVEAADRLQALVTASPAEQCLWAIVARTADFVTTASLAVTVRITYDCELFDRQVASQSLKERKEVKEDFIQVDGPSAPTQVIPNLKLEKDRVLSSPSRASTVSTRLGKG